MKNKLDLFKTIICHILGKSTDDNVLLTLSTFKNNILLQDKQYINEFKAYNTLEPRIITYLEKERDKEIALGLYNQFLIPISKYILKNDYVTALIIYRNLIKCLLTHSNLLCEYYELKSGSVSPKGRFGRRRRRTTKGY